MLGAKRARLYDHDGAPVAGFNALVLDWLSDRTEIREHATPKAFPLLRRAYELEFNALISAGDRQADVHRALIGNLTELMFHNDISGHLAERLSAERINPQGFRTALAQGVAKNTGENFINAIIFAIADCLADQDRILVDKGLPVPLKPLLTLTKRFEGRRSPPREIEIKIESDLAIWDRDNPHQAIVVSAKTRLKEIFHIGTMWKILYDMIGDAYLLKKWDLAAAPRPLEMLYCFATADMIHAGGTRTQGPDVERPVVRNLIAMDASFFDYVFVSKMGIGHAADELDLKLGREALFHELGCLLDLIEQKFAATGLELR